MARNKYLSRRFLDDEARNLNLQMKARLPLLELKSAAHI
jgi:hypothetical protein